MKKEFDKQREIETLIKFSEALGVSVDDSVHRELKEVKEKKALQLAKQIREKKSSKSFVNTPEKSTEEPQPQILEEVLLSPTVEASTEPEIDLVKEAYEILKQKTRLTESTSLESRVKGIENYLSTTYLGSYGSGEVRLKNLDDVDRYSVGNPDHILRYDPDTKKFYFGYISGDQGKINSLTFEDSGPQVTPVPGMIAWNHNEDCIDVYQNDGSTCQVGLETYIEVYNGTASTLSQGEVVKFAGAYGFNGWVKPTVEKFVADANSIPEYVIGVLTNDVAPGGTGRATAVGKVRELNTTGSTVGETWAVGDILFAHPTIPGQLTKNRPTAPNVKLKIGTVLKVSPTLGVLLVRPNIFPRLYYGNWHDETNQTAAAPNTAYPIRFGLQDPTSGFTQDPVDKSKIIAQNSGLFNFEFSLQFTSTNSTRRNIWVWYRKNGVDVPHSATNLTISENGGKLAPAWNFVVSMLPNDYFQLMWATDSTNVSLSGEPATAFCPSVPSAILSVCQVNQ